MTIEETLARLAQEAKEKAEHRRAKQRVTQKEYRERNKDTLRPKELERAKIYGKQNRSAIVSRNKTRRQAMKLRAVAHLGGKCVDCSGTFHPSVFDFHHLDPSQKERAKYLSNSWENVLEELNKCVLLCANCHRLRHHAWGEFHED